MKGSASENYLQRMKSRRVLTLAPNRESPCMDHAGGFVFEDMESRLEIRIHNAHVLWPFMGLRLKILVMHLLKNTQCHMRNILILLCF
jgi:hypothetical protein